MTRRKGRRPRVGGRWPHHYPGWNADGGRTEGGPHGSLHASSLHASSASVEGHVYEQNEEGFWGPRGAPPSSANHRDQLHTGQMYRDQLHTGQMYRDQLHTGHMYRDQLHMGQMYRESVADFHMTETRQFNGWSRMAGRGGAESMGRHGLLHADFRVADPSGTAWELAPGGGLPATPPFCPGQHQVPFPSAAMHRYRLHGPLSQHQPPGYQCSRREDCDPPAYEPLWYGFSEHRSRHHAPSHGMPPHEGFFQPGSSCPQPPLAQSIRFERLAPDDCHQRPRFPLSYKDMLIGRLRAVQGLLEVIESQQDPDRSGEPHGGGAWRGGKHAQADCGPDHPPRAVGGRLPHHGGRGVDRRRHRSPAAPAGYPPPRTDVVTDRHPAPSAPRSGSQGPASGWQCDPGAGGNPPLSAGRAPRVLSGGRKRRIPTGTDSRATGARGSGTGAYRGGSKAAGGRADSSGVESRDSAASSARRGSSGKAGKPRAGEGRSADKSVAPVSPSPGTSEQGSADKACSSAAAARSSTRPGVDSAATASSSSSSSHTSSETAKLNSTPASPSSVPRPKCSNVLFRTLLSPSAGQTDRTDQREAPAVSQAMTVAELKGEIVDAFARREPRAERLPVASCATEPTGERRGQDRTCQGSPTSSAPHNPPGSPHNPQRSPHSPPGSSHSPPGSPHSPPGSPQRGELMPAHKEVILDSTQRGAETRVFPKLEHDTDVMTLSYANMGGQGANSPEGRQTSDCTKDAASGSDAGHCRTQVVDVQPAVSSSSFLHCGPAGASPSNVYPSGAGGHSGSRLKEDVEDACFSTSNSQGSQLGLEDLGDICHTCLACRRRFASSTLLEDHLLEHMQFHMDDCLAPEDEEESFAQYDENMGREHPSHLKLEYLVDSERTSRDEVHKCAPSELSSACELCSASELPSASELSSGPSETSCPSPRQSSILTPNSHWDVHKQSPGRSKTTDPELGRVTPGDPTSNKQDSSRPRAVCSGPNNRKSSHPTTSRSGHHKQSPSRAQTAHPKPPSQTSSSSETTRTDSNKQTSRRSKASESSSNKQTPNHSKSSQSRSSKQTPNHSKSLHSRPDKETSNQSKSSHSGPDKQTPNQSKSSHSGPDKGTSNQSKSSHSGHDKETPNQSKSSHSGPDKGTSNQSKSSHSGPDKQTPNQSKSSHTGPDKGTSKQSKSSHSGPDKQTPNQSKSSHSGPDKGTSNQSKSSHSGPDKQTPNQSKSSHSGPDKGTSNQSKSSHTGHDKETPNQSKSSHSGPDKGTSNQSKSSHTGHDKEIPNQSKSSHSGPDKGTSNQSKSSHSGPDKQTSNQSKSSHSGPDKGTSNQSKSSHSGHDKETPNQSKSSHSGPDKGTSNQSKSSHSGPDKETSNQSKSSPTPPDRQKFNSSKSSHACPDCPDKQKFNSSKSSRCEAEKRASGSEGAESAKRWKILSSGQVFKMRKSPTSSVPCRYPKQCATEEVRNADFDESNSSELPDCPQASQDPESRPMTGRINPDTPQSSQDPESRPMTGRINPDTPQSSQDPESRPMTGRINPDTPQSSQDPKSGPMTGRINPDTPQSSQDPESRPMTGGINPDTPQSSQDPESGPMTGRIKKSTSMESFSTVPKSNESRGLKRVHSGPEAPETVDATPVKVRKRTGLVADAQSGKKRHVSADDADRAKVKDRGAPETVVYRNRLRYVRDLCRPLSVVLERVSAEETKPPATRGEGGLLRQPGCGTRGPPTTRCPASEPRANWESDHELQHRANPAFISKEQTCVCLKEAAPSQGNPASEREESCGGSGPEDPCDRAAASSSDKGSESTDSDTGFIFCMQCFSVFTNKQVFEAHACVLRRHDEESETDEDDEEPEEDSGRDGAHGEANEEAMDDNYGHSHNDDELADGDNPWHSLKIGSRSNRQSRGSRKRKPAKEASRETHKAPTPSTPKKGGRVKCRRKKTVTSSSRDHHMFTCSRCDQKFFSRAGLLFHWQHLHKKLAASTRLSS